MHRFWARKPHNVVSEYIEHYSSDGNMVLDPFAGSGVTAIEALKLGRKAIAVDLNPVATFITKMTAAPMNLDALRSSFERIKKQCSTAIMDLYRTNCPSCRGKAKIICSIWKSGEDRPKEIRLYCPHCKKRRKKKPTNIDIAAIKEICEKEISLWYPKDALQYPDGSEYKEGTHIKGVEGIPHLFTKRNLLALSILYDAIESLPSGDMRDFFKFNFTSMVHLASLMTPVRPTRPYSSFWPVHRYWIPPEFMESNVWILFDSAFNGKQGKLKGKEDSNATIAYFKEARSFQELEKDANILISTHSALDLSFIPNDKIDYAFTDPPYGGDIQYFELSTLWLAWLRGREGDPRFDLSWWREEVTINKQQGKDFEYYHNRLHVAFREIYRVVKPGKYLTVTFHSTDVKIYNSIIRAVLFSGFELERITYQPPARASAKALLQPYGSAIGDYYLRFRKPETPTSISEEREVDEARAKKIILESIKKILAERGQPTPVSDILKGHTMIYQELRKLGYHFFGLNPDNIAKILAENRDTEFVFIQGEGWWFKNPSKYHLQLPLRDRVEESIYEILHRKIATFDDILQSIYIKYTNALTPDPASIKMILQEYGEQVKEGKWQLKPKAIQREKEHSRMIVILAEIGKKVGCKVWIGQKEQGNVYEEKKLSTWCDLNSLDSLGLSSQAIDFLKQTDILWVRDNEIVYAFEVEYTTVITEAFNRCSNIPTEHGTTRILVLPEERERLLHRKISSELLKDRVANEGWRFIFFKNMEAFWEANKRRKRIDPKEIVKIAKTPMKEREKQERLESYLSK